MANTILNKLYFNFFTKTATVIVSKDGYFEFSIPNGFRYRYSKKMYQIINPEIEGFLFQWSGHVLIDNDKNQFDINKELQNAIKNNPDAVIQHTGKYDCICTTTTSSNKKEILYTWRIGEKNKRVLATLLLNGQQPRATIDQQIMLGGKLLRELHIKH